MQNAWEEVVLKEFSPDLIRRWLISLSPEELTEDIARERDIVQRHHRIGVTVLIRTFILGFTVGGESCTTAEFQRVYAAAINRTLSRSNFYDRFTPTFGQLFNDLLEHALEEVAVPHTLVPQLQQFRDAMIAGATVSRLRRLPSKFPATHPNQSGTKLHLVHNLTEQTIERLELTDERNHESNQFYTRNRL